MLSIHRGNTTLSFKQWAYPAGETGIRLDTDNLRFHYATEPIRVVARIRSDADMAALVMVTEALWQWTGTRPTHLTLPYIPNGRQDRVCVQGEAFGVLAFARQIAAMGYTHLTTFDCHSPVTAAVFNAVGIHVTEVAQLQVLGRFPALNARLAPGNPFGEPLLCAPDTGAAKKVAEAAAHYGHSLYVQANKVRDLATGKIKEISILNPAADIEDRDVLVLDDIGDRCGTFVGVAKALKAKGAASVELYLTHGLFTAEIDSILNPLCEAGVSRVWTTNSYRTDLEQLGKQNLLTVLGLEYAFTL